MNPTRILNLILALVLALSLSFQSISLGSAQDPQGHIRPVRSMSSEETGVLHPVGLAFSASSQNFYVIDGKSQGPSLAAQSEVVALKSHSGQVEVGMVATVIEDPLNVVFDNKNNRLLAFQPTTGQIVEVRESPGGKLDRTTVIPHNVRNLTVESPAGLALDVRSGSLFILDAVGPRIVRIEPQPNGNFAGGQVSVLDLASKGLAAPHGIAFDPSTGHLHVFDSDKHSLYELTLSGELVASRDLTAFNLENPQAMVFAPSGDRTDDPAQTSLYVADSTLTTDSSSEDTGEIVEFSFAEAAALPGGTTLLPTTLIQTIDTSNAVWNPSAPDPTGLDYWPLTGRLLMADSEVDEMKSYFTGKNVFDVSLSGSLVSSCSTTNLSRTGFSNEPTGLGINRDNNRIYFTDDDANNLHEVSLGSDGVYCTADDGLTTVNVGSVYDIQDAEDVAYGNNRLFIAGGTDAEVYTIPLGANGVLGGGDDGPLTRFDTASLGFNDLEGVGYNWDSGTLFILSADSSDKYLGETTTTGTLLNAYGLDYAGLTHREDVTYAPSSQNPAVKSIYITDRGIDNNTDSSENDGQIWEFGISHPGSPTPGSSPTNTPTALPGGEARYFSFATNSTVNGVAFADEDILHFDGQTWTLFFDGSDVGAGSADLFAFHIVNANTLLMSFSAELTLNGMAVTPQDIVRFDATSLGLNTAGTFSMYFNGVDVGLDNTTAEKIDSLGVLADGRVLISTSGDISVPGVSGKDEDVLVFTPASLGGNTSGTWAMYFDGSDVGLSDSTDEDVDALDIANGAIYLSTTAEFSVNGVSGAGEDIFVCTPGSLGDVTACNFSSALLFDGSAWGLAGNSVDGFHLQSASSAPSATPTSKFTATPSFTPSPSATPTITGTATNTLTPTSTFTPSRTPTPSNTSTQTATALPPGNSFFTSFALNSTVGGVAFADEDIVRFDGQSWSLYFDGSDVGAGSVDLFAFNIVNANTILMSFSANVTLSGVAFTPQDIARFDATSLGSNTAGTFSMYFNGVDVGMDVSAERIDGLGVLPDGRILISTVGNPVVTGVSSARDEDILAFTPSSLGSNTSGTWAMYFDGSDVGLAETSDEDIDAVSLAGGNIYLSTLGNFSVNGVSGAGEDVFVCSPASVGDVTACNYSSALFFDGSAWGLAGNSIDGFSLGTETSLSSSSFSSSAGDALVVVNTDTTTPTATHTPEPINTATPTPTATATATSTETPTAP